MACVSLLSVDGIQLDLAVAGEKAQQVAEWLSSDKGTVARRKLQKILLDVVWRADEPASTSALDCVASEAKDNALPDSFEWVGAEDDSVAGEDIKPSKETESPRYIHSVPVPDGSSRKIPAESEDQEHRDPTEPTKAKNGISLARRMRAYTAGVEAGKKLRGEVAYVAATPQLDELKGLPRQFYVVLRGLRGEPGVYKRLYCNRHGAGADGVVCQDTDDGGKQDPYSVHHGFLSATEVADYCNGAEVAVPQQLP